MKIRKFGSGKNLFNIIVGVHGDEISPIQGFILLEKYLQNKSIKKSFTVIIANEEAVEAKKRFLKIDLNRCFPGNQKGLHEAKLAHKLLVETAKTEFNFDFHSTVTAIKPYGIISIYSKKLHRVMRATGIKQYLFDNSESLIKFAPNAIAFEVGREGELQSTANAFAIMKNILIYFNVIDDKIKFKQYMPDIYLIYNFILRSKILSVSKKLADFRYVKKGEIIGYMKNKEPITAREGFYPILVNDTIAIKKAKKIIIKE